ncbi:MAG: stage II sporulation protein P [Oscillospiraceae bacterium]|nr:stage II sporulation protein P [Oscillospiraceae bacterium]
MPLNENGTRRNAARRGAALLMAGAALWVVSFTTDPAGAIRTIRELGESPAFVTQLLEAELGAVEDGDGLMAALTAWQKSVLNQSALLSAGVEGVEALWATQEQDQEPEPAATAPVETPPPETAPAETLPPVNVVERTLTAHDGGNYASADDIHINNTTSKTLDVAALLQQSIDIQLGEGPQILIMHTHGSEAYTMDGTDLYEPSDNSRTTDEQFNMIRIGEEMKAEFEALGLEVVHDTSLYDYPGYSGSYDRSKAGVEAYLSQYPTIKLVLDVHRDALIASDGTTYKAVTEVNGEKTAQVMMVIGSNDTGLEHPNWTRNLSLAVHLQRELNDSYPTLARPITLRTSRFNQQLTTGSILVEVGTNGNTLQEAIRGARLFAQTAGEFFVGLRTS